MFGRPHLPDAVVAVGMAARAGHQRPIGNLARVVIVKTVVTRDVLVVKADRHGFVVWLAIQGWLGRLKGVVMVNEQSIIVVVRPV